jgi:hypothetical protein
MFSMTRDEIRLVLFVLAALSVGSMVQWRRGAESTPTATAAPKVEPKRGWATPPYVFKTRAEMDRVKESLEPPQSQR